MTPSRLIAVLASAARGRTRDFADLCDRMVWFDGNIRANLETRIAMVTASPWEVVPGKSRVAARQERAVDGAAFAEGVLRELDVFEQANSDLLDAIAVGWAVTETDWDRVDGADVPVDIRRIHPRRFVFGDEWEPRLVDDGETYDAAGRDLRDFPRGKFIIHQPRIRASYPGVAGVLRTCAWLYLFRRWTTQFWVRGVEKFAWPTMVGKVKRGAGDTVRSEMKLALRDAANDHFLVTEVDQEVAMLETLVKDAGSFRDLDEALKAEQSKAILGSTDQAEPIKIGAWKAVESRKGTTVDSRAALDAYHLDKTLRAQLIAPLLEFNSHLFGGVVPAIPEIRHLPSGIHTPVDEGELSALLELARSSGMQPTLDSVRSMASALGLRLEDIPKGEDSPRALPLAPTDVAKVVRAVEARASVGLDPFDDDRDDQTVSDLGALPGAPPVSEP